MKHSQNESQNIPKHPKTNAWISTSQIAQEGDKVLLKSSQGEIFEVEPEVLKPNHCDVHILIRRVGENKILEMENIGAEMCWRFSCLYDYMDYIWLCFTYICTVYIFTMACWSVFLDKVKGTNGIWLQWFEFDPPVAQGGLHVHAGEEHGGWQWNWWRDPFAKRQLLSCWKPKMPWVCDGSSRDLSAQICWFWGQDRNPEQGGDGCIQKERDRERELLC